MNERIKELRGKVKMDLTKFHSDPEFFKNHVEPLAKIFDNGDNAVLNEYMTKFAELIVKECASYMYEHYPHSRYEINYMRKHMGDADWNKPIKEHFGVEE